MKTMLERRAEVAAELVQSMRRAEALATDLKAYLADVPGSALVERVDDRVAISHGEKHIEVRVLHEGARIGREVLSDEAMLDSVYAFVHDATIVGG